ncbi:DNA-processing protein DprA [Micromonospora sp. WMMD1082]|uniref:DNA-processing protein DprA n=1 Tax=Micromonospora sp. WMMD1082 TaxID=3016104 RepID=UPI0024161DFB|nr:DNA-processing protein DprA [Micromonospora sp. WMMD1082]MDG4792992.1 DNA-protecting protein DprA [Micromonospora sp. WMMD1082]
MDAATIERAALVALLRRPGTSWSETALEIQENGSAASVLDRAINQPETLFPVAHSTTELVDAAAHEIAGWQADGIGVHTFFDDTYPAQLRGIREMPPLLFSRGDLRVHDRAVAVVGSRSASEQGLRIARAVATALAGRGVTVVSGLAKGIDTAAHSAALEAGGRTVAVIGTGINRYYPAANRRLQDHITEVGLVISQFWPDAQPSRQSFPMRNAVMSGYAVATVVVEAGETSGARIQARLALQHGRPVVLTSQVMQCDWARRFAENPGVYVVHGTMELLEAVNDILSHQPTEAGLENFPELAFR